MSSSPSQNNSTNFIVIVLIAAIGILIWQRDTFPAGVVYGGIAICAVLLFFWVRRLIKSK
jgi:hypothetical protein